MSDISYLIHIKSQHTEVKIQLWAKVISEGMCVFNAHTSSINPSKYEENIIVIILIRF